MQRFTEIEVWKRSHELVLEVYRMTRSFPDDEKFGITSQLRRAAVSVPCNIAEGSKKKSQKDYARFLNTSEGSLTETEYLLMLARSLNYLNPTQANQLIETCGSIAAQLYRLRKKVESSE